MKYILLFAALCWPAKAEKGLITGKCGPGTCGISVNTVYPEVLLAEKTNEPKPHCSSAVCNKDGACASVPVACPTEPKPLTTRWRKVLHFSQCKFAGWSADYGRTWSCTDGEAGEIGLRSDHTVIWR